MKRAALFLLTLPALIGLTLSGSGCMVAARRHKAETAFDRLAARTPDQIADYLNNRLSTKLGLTADQLPRVYAIDLDYAIKIQAAAASSEGTVSKARTMGKAADAHTADLKEVLTADQFATFLTIKEELRADLKEARNQPGKFKALPPQRPHFRSYNRASHSPSCLRGRANCPQSAVVKTYLQRSG